MANPKQAATSCSQILTTETLEVPFLAGFITSKKTGKAVIRNRIRRRLRAIVTEFAARIRPGTMLVTIARHRVAEASYHRLRAEWVQQARRLGILTSD